MLLSLLLATTLRQAAARDHLDVGFAITPSFLSEPEYAQIAGTEFSVLEAENATKFEPIHPRPGNQPGSYDFAEPDKILAFAEAHHMKMRGHTLVWHSQIAPWVRRGNYTPEQMNEILHGHIDAVLKHFGRKVFAWDVVNEAFEDNGSLRSTPWFNRPGIGLADQGTKYIEQAFRWAHEANPSPKLFYNDYGIELLGKKSDAVLAMLRDFRSRHVPVDGIGFQMHVGFWLDNPGNLASLEQNMKRFSDLGLIIHVTELDMGVPNGDPDTIKRQAELYGKIVAICRRNPAVKLIQFWGITDGHSWLNRGANSGHGLLWDENYQRKPAYQAVMAALAR